MDMTPLQSILVWLGTALGVGLGFLVAGALIILLMVQVLRDAYHSPAPGKYPHRVKLSTVALLVVFGFGMLLRILQMQGLAGQ
jgi:chromate transport protein ChrA